MHGKLVQQEPHLQEGVADHEPLYASPKDMQYHRGALWTGHFSSVCKQYTAYDSFSPCFKFMKCF